jgi:transcription elongation factor Elf1
MLSELVKARIRRDVNKMQDEALLSCANCELVWCTMIANLFDDTRELAAVFHQCVNGAIQFQPGATPQETYSKGTASAESAVQFYRVY